MPPTVVDIGINLTHKSFRKHWRNVVQRAINAGVDKILLTGTSIRGSKESLTLAQQWLDESGGPNLFVTIGVHPHDAKTWTDQSLQDMKQMLEHPLAVAVGECGLDFNRNFSSREEQIHAFRQQMILACQLQMPVFVHEREAHQEFVQVLDEVAGEYALPPIVVHCFTGTREEAMTYVQRGYFLGFTGTICKRDRGAPLRELLPCIPLDKIMVETDAPFMGFKKDRRSSEPMDCIDVAAKVAETINVPFQTVCDVTTANALKFFGLETTFGSDKKLSQSRESSKVQNSPSRLSSKPRPEKDVIRNSGSTSAHAVVGESEKWGGGSSFADVLKRGT